MAGSSYGAKQGPKKLFLRSYFCCNYLSLSQIQQIGMWRQRRGEAAEGEGKEGEEGKGEVDPKGLRRESSPFVQAAGGELSEEACDNNCDLYGD